ncbi:tetratricopeptide repeat protein 28-like [Stylophora pistillata]|nr:tetratricopeptide repeat protein 28-like [Stylophora pistillata]
MYLKALDCYNSSVAMFNDTRDSLTSKDEWKISYRSQHQHAYTGLWRSLLRRGKITEALLAAEEARSQALKDLMDFKYGSNAESYWSPFQIRSAYDSLSDVASSTIFMAVSGPVIFLWVVQGCKVHLRATEFKEFSSEEELTTLLNRLYINALKEIGTRTVKCENRSLDDDRSDEAVVEDRTPHDVFHPLFREGNTLKRLYDMIVAPILDLIDSKELLFVPEGPLCLVPFPAFVDSKSKYLSEAHFVRVIPSLTTLKMITDCPVDFHNSSGALLVGDPCLEGVLYEGKSLAKLKFARKEVEMIGEILGIEPLVGVAAKKREVLGRLSSVALVHIAAHGKMETGEILMSPNTTMENGPPEEKEYLLTMTDVLKADLRARLVVLSCCHSARGEVTAEGVVGIARAFLGAGARSVLVSLWALGDEATLEFMKYFYGELSKLKSASEALNRAMKCMRQSEKFNEVKNWAPFVLIGDDVILDLKKS